MACNEYDDVYHPLSDTPYVDNRMDTKYTKKEKPKF